MTDFFYGFKPHRYTIPGGGSSRLPRQRHPAKRRQSGNDNYWEPAHSEDMRTDDLSSSAGSVLFALVFAVLFAMSFLLAYSPERLLAQIFLGVLVIDGLRPLLSPLNVGIIRTISGIAYFITRTIVLVVLCRWYFDILPRMVSTAMSDDGWAFAIDLGRVVFFVVAVSLVFLTILLAIGHSVWGDIFGRKMQGKERPQQ